MRRVRAAGAFLSFFAAVCEVVHFSLTTWGLARVGQVCGLLSLALWVAVAVAVIVVYRRAGGSRMLAEMGAQPLKNRPGPPSSSQQYPRR